jgi:hypothetical protein
MPNRPLNLPVGLVLAEGIDGPYRGRNPANQRRLQEQTEKGCHRTARGEVGEPTQDQHDQETHGTLKRAARTAKSGVCPARQLRWATNGVDRI